MGGNIVKSKVFQFAMALILAAAIVTTGTYAWSGFASKMETKPAEILPEEVLLFDFSDQLGEIYAVNNSRDHMLIRIKFTHFLKIHGNSVVPGALESAPATWPAENAVIQKYYRPVFGKSVIPLSNWIQEGCTMGDYWIADSDGWFYYAKKLAPGEATRTLLSEIAVNQFNGLTDAEYKTAVFLQAAVKSDLENLFIIDSNSFSTNGRLIMRYVSGEMVEFIR